MIYLAAFLVGFFLFATQPLVAIAVYRDYFELRILAWVLAGGAVSGLLVVGLIAGMEATS